MTGEENLLELSERLHLVEKRLTALEPATSLDPRLVVRGDILGALEGLEQRVQHSVGSVLMTGAVTVPRGHRAQSQMQVAAHELFEIDFASRAASLSALAHPVRLQLLQRLLTDASTVEEVREAGDFGTSGQVYHHLRQLVAADWVTSLGSSRYEVPPDRIVPLLVILMAVDL